jgi:hypothetical protein
MYHLLYQSLTLHSVFVGIVWLPEQTSVISRNSINRLIIVNGEQRFLYVYTLFNDEFFSSSDYVVSNESFISECLVRKDVEGGCHSLA